MGWDLDLDEKAAQFANERMKQFSNTRALEFDVFESIIDAFRAGYAIGLVEAHKKETPKEDINGG